MSRFLEFRDLIKKFRRGAGIDAETASSQVFHDCILHIKTVRATQCEDSMVQDFNKLVQQEGFKNRTAMVKTGCIKGLAYGLEMGLYAFAFWWTAKVMEGGDNFQDCTQAMMCIILGLMP